MISFLRRLHQSVEAFVDFSRNAKHVDRDNHLKYKVAPAFPLHLSSNTVERCRSWRLHWRKLIDCYRKGIGVKLKSATRVQVN